ncbi:MAG: UDP-N-acetylmuramoyl-L-alanyl-D-glutamate--2,6-diaminopimelate ligase [Oscillospiraceae bacterium]|jgi:UDP-N-acetylmuramoyl-L-alanyl-D-glutamate--2,6-diaminopimelate ligase|nr:UDP-N-acetylmuramoyl-L-alanyl-D-glutamate--2,6-diaminopimelate ligase [Oscillospiraceae bacterium]
MKLFTLLQALDTLQTNAPSLDSEVDGVHNDTRLMKRGDLFVAVPGSETDGHCYIRQAIESGASMIVTERALDPSVPHVVVPDARAALAKLAACMAGYPADKLVMAGVTGTKGKTTVTHLLKGLIDTVTDGMAGLVGTNHIFIGNRELPAERTTPNAVMLHGVLAEMTAEGCTHCVMEVSSHALAQARVLGIRYAVGAFTNLHHEHLDYHKDMEEYFQVKSGLFGQCEKAVVNIDDPWGRRLLETLPDAFAFTCEGRDCPGHELFSALNIRLRPDGVTFDVAGPSFLLPASWVTPGLFSVSNALAAFACGAVMGLPPDGMARALSGLPPVKGRMEPVPAETECKVIIDYAHTPDAIAAALKAARAFTKGRLIALFGCGGDRDKTKRPLMGAAAQQNADLCYVTSDNPRSEDPNAIFQDILAGMENRELHVEPDRRKAIRAALAEAGPGDTLMLIGKGHENYQEINGVKIPFDEREVVREAVRA